MAGGRPTDYTEEKKAKCPCCSRAWPIGCEQEISIRFYGECIVCKFSPQGKGSNNGTTRELDIVSIEAKMLRKEADKEDA